MIDVKSTSTVVDNSECDRCHTKTLENDLTTLFYRGDYNRYDLRHTYRPAVDLCQICLAYLINERRKK
jgi:hypothetical protein